ncbi:hypothetical protein PI124_g13834 [Phytophthora idaei]|nr:hypothetical protein PI124_g13834 [Phytophthora idaei]
MPRFKARWRELRREGWDSRHPTGLSNDYIYVMPGKTKKDKRGVDFFVGEKELMLYLDRVDLGTTTISRQEGEPADSAPNVQASTQALGKSGVTTTSGTDSTAFGVACLAAVSSSAPSTADQTNNRSGWA